MDINQFLYFIQVFKDKNISKAAQHLYITQQGLSMAIVRMEKELNHKLFVRTPSGLVPTECGCFLFEKAKRIIEEYEDCQNYFSTLPRPKESFTIACVYRAIDWCPETSRKAMFQYDTSHIKMIECPGLDGEALLERDECDIAIVDGPVDPEKFESTFLIEKSICFVVHPENPLAERESIQLADLCDKKLVFENRRFKAYHTLHRLCKERGFTPNIILECDRHSTCYSMVKSNPNLIGSCFNFNEPYINSIGLKMLRLSDIEIPWKLYLLTKKSKPRTDSLERFISELVYWFENNHIQGLPNM